MANIILIDDEHGPIDLYADALREAGHQVEQLDTVEKVFDHLDKKKPADLYIVDIMIPTHGHDQMKAAADGLASGIMLHKKIRRLFSKVPIIILTAISNPEIISGLRVEGNTTIQSKIDTLPSDLVERVGSQLTE